MEQQPNTISVVNWKNVYGRAHGKAQGLEATRFKNLQNSKRELISYFYIFWYCEGMKLDLAQSICLIRGRQRYSYIFLAYRSFINLRGVWFSRFHWKLFWWSLLILLTLSTLFFLFISPLSKYFNLRKIENGLAHSRYSVKSIIINSLMDDWMHGWLDWALGDLGFNSKALVGLSYYLWKLLCIAFFCNNFECLCGEMCVS